MKASYDDWRVALVDELEYLGLSADEAFDQYSFVEAYEYGMKPREAVQDYLDSVHQTVKGRENEAISEIR